MASQGPLSVCHTHTRLAITQTESGLRWSEAANRRGVQPPGQDSYPTLYAVTTDRSGRLDDS